MSNLLHVVHDTLFVLFIGLGLFIVGSAVKSLFTKKKVTC